MGALISLLQANSKCHKQYEIIIGGDFNCNRSHKIFRIIEETYKLKVVDEELD